MCVQLPNFLSIKKRWLDQLNMDETDEEQLCEVCFKHCPPSNILKGMMGQPPA